MKNRNAKKPKQVHETKSVNTQAEANNEQQTQAHDTNSKHNK